MVRLSPLFAAVLCLLLAAPALASHYPLEVVPFVEADHKARLAAQKLEDTEALLHALLTPEARKRLADTAGIPEEKLLEYARTCDLLRIRGVGPKMAKLLLLTGVQSLSALRAEKPETLLPTLRETNKQHGISEILPQEETLKDWIHQARALEIIVK